MPKSHREKREDLPSENALTSLVDGSLAKLDRLLKRPYKSSEKEEYIQELSSWWAEMKVLLRSYIEEKNYVEKILSNLLHKPHLSDEQLKQIGEVLESKKLRLTKYCFPPSGNIEVARQLEDILDEILYYSEYYFHLDPPEHPLLKDGKIPKLSFEPDDEDAWDDLR